MPQAAHFVESAREMLLEYGEFVAAQPNVASFCYGDLKQEAALLPGSYLDKGGGALLARRAHEPLAFVAWRALPGDRKPSAWELKRLWVRPQARGLGLGQRLVEAVIGRARVAGKTELLLDTAPTAMAAAHQLYLDMGFLPCPAYSGSPQDGIAYLRKDISPSQTGGAA